MRVLFDQGTPVPLRSAFSHHIVETAYERGWQMLTNGELLEEAEAAGFEVLVTTDQNLRQQQNLAGRKIAILVLKTTSWRRIQQRAEMVAAVTEALRPSEYREMTFPK
jgi:predicted nuclease of predicted toxin-antitoxin system